MKNKLLTLTLILTSFAAQSQFGIKMGPSFSYFTQGDPTYKGIKHGYTSITGGLFVKSKHFQVELNYLQMGSKNPREDGRTFKTYNLMIPVMYVANIGDFSLQAGGYISRIVGASNSDFFTPGTPNFGWAVGKSWKWYRAYDAGLSGGFGFNLHNAYLQFSGRHGLRNVRRDKRGYDGLYDRNYDGSRNASLECAIYVPIN